MALTKKKLNTKNTETEINEVADYTGDILEQETVVNQLAGADYEVVGVREFGDDEAVFVKRQNKIFGYYKKDGGIYGKDSVIISQSQYAGFSLEEKETAMIKDTIEYMIDLFNQELNEMKKEEGK